MNEHDKAYYERGFKHEMVVSETNEDKTYKELTKILVRKYMSNSKQITSIKKEYNYNNSTYNITVYFKIGFIEKFYNIEY